MALCLYEQAAKALSFGWLLSFRGELNEYETVTGLLFLIYVMRQLITPFV